MRELRDVFSVGTQCEESPEDMPGDVRIVPARDHAGLERRDVGAESDHNGIVRLLCAAGQQTHTENAGSQGPDGCSVTLHGQIILDVR